MATLKTLPLPDEMTTGFTPGRHHRALFNPNRGWDARETSPAAAVIWTNWRRLGLRDIELLPGEEAWLAGRERF
ncbi:MAG: hypothetical protein U0Q12_02335 [Vicinamibacterales bacterium]